MLDDQDRIHKFVPLPISDGCVSQRVTSVACVSSVTDLKLMYANHEDDGESFPQCGSAVSISHDSTIATFAAQSPL